MIHEGYALERFGFHLTLSTIIISEHEQFTFPDQIGQKAELINGLVEVSRRTSFLLWWIQKGSPQGIFRNIETQGKDIAEWSKPVIFLLGQHCALL